MVAELLQKIVEIERSKIDPLDIRHAPTIGDMYEGLSKRLLESSIPEELDLRVVSGFVKNDLGYVSGQIDAMIVSGEGDKLPNIEQYIYHVSNVIAVFEVKKNLKYADLKDAFHHLSVIWDLYHEDINQSQSKKEIDIESIEKEYSIIYGEHSKGFWHRDRMNDHERLKYDALLHERMQPIRIILAYEGYKTELGIREALFRFNRDYFEENGQGFGVPAFPTMITSSGITLVKCNGQPYSSISSDGYWDFYASTTFNPLIVMLELIWTRISRDYDVMMPWGDDLKIERLNIYLKARPHAINDKTAWEISYFNVLNDSFDVEYDWMPTELELFESVILMMMAKNDVFDLKSDEAIKMASENGFKSPLSMVSGLLSSRIVALSDEGRFIKYVTSECQIIMTPEGK
ncbi:hypothetical protein IHN32_16630, partial [Deinococcus sp. 14RED07]|uniref:DUF6602 domain-containing protein n=1 Tax=Deinococcus sp. 14RED07 TaxID=2745874 RepID=UPI001E4DACCA